MKLDLADSVSSFWNDLELAGKCKEYLRHDAWHIVSCHNWVLRVEMILNLDQCLTHYNNVYTILILIKTCIDFLKGTNRRSNSF